MALTEGSAALPRDRPAPCGRKRRARPSRTQENGDGGQEAMPVATYSIGKRVDLRRAEGLAASLEISPEDGIAATGVERARAAVYLFLALAATGFLVGTLVLSLG